MPFLKEVLIILIKKVDIKKLALFIQDRVSFFISIGAIMATTAFLGVGVLGFKYWNLDRKYWSLDHKITYLQENSAFKAFVFKNNVDIFLKRLVKLCGDKSYTRLYIKGMKTPQGGVYAALVSNYKCEKINKDDEDCVVSDNFIEGQEKEQLLDVNTLSFLQNDKINFVGYESLRFTTNNVLVLNLLDKNGKPTELFNRIKADYYQIYKIITDSRRLVATIFLIKGLGSINYVVSLGFAPDSEIKCSVANFGHNPQSLLMNLETKINRAIR